MQMIYFQKKCINFNTIEGFHIHREAAANNYLNDDHTIATNKIFDTILKDFQHENQHLRPPRLPSLSPSATIRKTGSLSLLPPNLQIDTTRLSQILVFYQMQKKIRYCLYTLQVPDIFAYVESIYRKFVIDFYIKLTIAFDVTGTTGASYL